MNDPNWRRNIAEAMAVRRKTGKRGRKLDEGAFKRNLSPLRFHADVDFIQMFDAAARTLNVNRSTYVRRAIAVQVSRHLGIPVSLVLWHSPCSGEYGKGQDYPGERDLGEGIQNFCPHPGCDGRHFD